MNQTVTTFVLAHWHYLRYFWFAGMTLYLANVFVFRLRRYRLAEIVFMMTILFLIVGSLSEMTLYANDDPRVEVVQPFVHIFLAFLAWKRWGWMIRIIESRSQREEMEHKDNAV